MADSRGVGHFFGPRRGHFAGRDYLFDGFYPGAGFPVGEERIRCQLVRPMATLTAVLQNGKHIFVIGESPIYRRRGDHGHSRQKGQHVSTSHEPKPLSPDRHDDDQAPKCWQFSCQSISVLIICNMASPQETLLRHFTHCPICIVEFPLRGADHHRCPRLRNPADAGTKRMARIAATQQIAHPNCVKVMGMFHTIKGL
jgi:hypothetical protein